MMARYLLSRGARPKGHWAIFDAISGRRSDLVELLLTAGADVRERNGYYGLSVIQAAAERRLPGAVGLIAEAGGLADARSKSERTLWRAALEHERDDILMDLVAFGANARLLKTPERQRLHALITNGRHEEVLRLLALADARAAQLETAIKQGNLRRVRSFYSSGAEIAEGRMRTGLIMAIEARKPLLVKWFLEQGADPLAPIHYGNLVWLRHMAKGHASNPAEPISSEIRARHGGRPPRGTAFTQVFEHGPLASVRLVVDRVDPPKQKVEPFFGSVLHQAFFGFKTHRDPKIIDLAVELSEDIPKTGPGADAFLREVCFWTAPFGTKVLKTWLKRGYRPWQKDGPPAPSYPNDDPAFNKCLDAGAEPALLMLRHGADPNLAGSFGTLPLMDALHRISLEPAYLDVIRELLKQGADPNRPGGYTDLVLDRVRFYLRHTKEDRRAHYEEVERLLLKHGAKTRAQLEQAGVLKPIPEPERPIPVR